MKIKKLGEFLNAKAVMISYEAKKRVPNESLTSFSRSYPNNYSFSQ